MPVLQIAVQQSASPALIAIVFSANSLFTILLSAVFLREKLVPLQVVAALFCTVGVVLCALPISGGQVKPVLMAMFSALTFSLYTALAKKYLSHIGNAIKITLSFFFGGVALFVFLMITGSGISVVGSSHVLFCLLILGVLVTGFGYLCYFKTLELGGAYTAAFAFFIKPVLAPFVAYWIGGSLPSVNALIAIPFIVIGSFLNVFSTRARAK